MTDVMEYKCPACGGAMEFDSKSQKMKCPYCDTEMDISEFEEQKDNTFQKEENAGWTDEEISGMKVYVCESCGGEIVAEETTGASTCPFCGNRIVVKGQFADELKPDLIIPFQLDKKEAKARYRKHLEGKKFLPKVFKSENHIDEIKGLYVPFWLFDADVQGYGSYSAQKIRVWTTGDTEHTETKYYHVERAGNISFQHIPADASKKMDDTLMESIEPYNAEEAVPFQTAYLAGYMADRYDVDMEERFKRAAERIKASTEEALRDTVKGYQAVTTSGGNVDIKNTKYKYAMYPVWILNTTWKGEKYIFAMNGQTGKMVGNLPVDKKAFWKYVMLRWIPCGMISFVLLMILSMML